MNFLVTENSTLPKCNSSAEWSAYRGLIHEVDSTSPNVFFERIGCTPQCKHTSYTMKPLSSGNFDSYTYKGGDHDNASIGVSWFFTHKLDIKILYS